MDYNNKDSQDRNHKAGDKNIDISEKKEKDYTGIFLPVGIGLGVSLGIIFDNLAIGISLGAALGLATGAVVGTIKKKK
ncbi:glycine zipper family protein [Sedimentibacter hydroxybenzoicus DSM 7310]|uniref:Glycine zipper family protein n=1 Tax=Sedimentibacter hydroxybenzoicus DSM 7310 TaxID=1123245 RepID=A0A974BMB9_SEDHY|nr:glycine zipper family protein [Sedimentibacter hydroxybenzoicus]NYB76049.1 glycine zipper family protein [Sedimentibacter hydroxybenzoicus DSM 7310]